MTEPSESADTTITLDFADAAKARDAFDRIEVWLHEVGIANDCTLAMSTALGEDQLRDAARYRWLLKQTVISGTELYDLYAACNWEPAEGQIGALIDAEIAREAESGGDE